MHSFSKFLLLFLLAAIQAVLTGATECESYGYMYTLQPPEAIVCSPYIRGVLNLTCAVAGDLVEDIQWYFMPADGGPTVVLTNSSQVTITQSQFDGDYSVVMIVRDLTEANEGSYWCQGLVWHHDHSLELSQSAVFLLQPRDQYIPFTCPNKALKSSEVRCAAVIPLPVASSPITLLSLATFEVSLPSGESLTIDLDHSRTVPGHVPTMPTMPTRLATARPTPTFQPTITDNTIGGGGTTDQPTTDPLTDTFGTTGQPPLTQGSVQLSDIILYAILGLLGFLVLLVFSLSIVISILCCKKRHRVLEGKDAPYDQFSTGSEAPHGVLTLKSLDSYPLAAPLPPPPYRLPLHPSSTVTSSSSGVYDEIHTIIPQQIPLYQEIPVLHMDNTTGSTTATPTTSQRERRTVSAGDSIPRHGSSSSRPVNDGSEHPYDLPNTTGTAQGSQGDALPAANSSEHHLQQEEKQSGYDSLEPAASSLLTEQVDGRSSMGDSSDFTNSNLQVTPPPDDKKVIIAPPNSSGIALDMEPVAMSLPFPPPPPPPPLTEVLSTDQEESASSLSSSTLPAIPENPYHVLEDSREPVSRGNRSPPLDADLGNHTGCNTEARPLRLLSCHLSFSEDEGYDRLVGPPHIYHILQKSPSLVRPRVRECSPVSGYHHLSNRLDVEMLRGGEQQQQQHQVHCPTNLQGNFPVEAVTVHSEESSMVSGSEIFDDPQYNFSPKRTTNVSDVSRGVGAQQGKPVQRNSHSGQVTTLERKRLAVKRENDVDLSKYRGDYERDPLYMQKLSEPVTCEDSDHVEVCLLAKRDVAGSNKSASLPDITHTYQSLQPLTRDPLTNYEMLHRRQLNANV